MAAAEPLYRYAVTPGTGEVFFSPGQLQAVAEAAGPGGRVELNTFQQLIVHTADPDLEGQWARLRALGLAVYPVGPVVKNLRTCTFCMGENVAGLPAAVALDAAIAGEPVPFPTRVGFGGCWNNCGEATMQDVGLVRMQDETYTLYLGGKPGSLEPQVGRPLARGLRPEELPAAVQAVLACYRQHARGKERFWKTLGRVGEGPFRAAVAAALGQDPSPSAM